MTQKTLNFLEDQSNACDLKNQCRDESVANLRMYLDLGIIEDLCRSANMETERMN